MQLSSCPFFIDKQPALVKQTACLILTSLLFFGRYSNPGGLVSSLLAERTNVACSIIAPAVQSIAECDETIIFVPLYDLCFN